MFKVAFLKTLSTVGLGIFIASLVALVAEAISHRYSSSPTAIVDALRAEMEDGSCILVVKMYGTNEALLYQDDTCLAAMEAARQYINYKASKLQLGAGERTDEF